jgi:hypothetical protein
MRLRRAVVAAFVVAIAGCFPAGASADGNHYVLPAGAFIETELGSSNGYSISIWARLGGEVGLTAKKGRIVTDYYVRNARVDANRVQAKLPGLGRISVRFHQRGRAHHSPAIAGCDGSRPTVRRGVVRGTIKFTGEREYTKVKTHQAHAETEEWARQRCRYGGRHHHPRWTNRFQAWGGESPRVGFSAEKLRPGAIQGGRVVFRASTASSHRSIYISRRATVVAPTSTFLIPEPDTYPEHLILTPPAPFVGSGTFARNPESVFTWEGDLSIQFPGIDPLPLAGTSFNTGYCAIRGCIRQDADSGTG